jgi:hypothetical protein
MTIIRRVVSAVRPQVDTLVEPVSTVLINTVGTALLSGPSHASLIDEKTSTSSVNSASGDGILNRNSLHPHQAKRSRCATTKAASSRVDTDRFTLDFPSLAEAIEDMKGIPSATIDVIDGW